MQVPLKRVNQAYVIATSTKIDLKGADVSKVEDSHFKATKEPREKKGEEGFFKKETEQEEKVCTEAQQLLLQCSGSGPAKQAGLMQTSCHLLAHATLVRTSYRPCKSSVGLCSPDT